MQNILCVDDDIICLKSIKAALASEYRVFTCESIEQAKKLIQSSTTIDLIVLDRGLPDGDGIELCNFLNENQSLNKTPVIFLTAANSEPEKIMAFYAGADDYVTKPFSLLELKARIHARLKVKQKSILLGNLEVDIENQRACLIDSQKRTEIDLTRTEFKILAVLLKNAGNLQTRENLLEKVWGSNTHVADRVIDSHVSHLRKKISNAGVQITSLRGEGYQLSLDSTSQTNSKAG